MGQRANLVLVEAERYKLYYNHWCANTLPSDLFWGPDHALAFITRQEPTDQWLDDIWAEGGAILDIEVKRVILFGGEDELLDIPYRRLFLRLMRKVWRGWEVRWAHGGIIDIAEYTGTSAETVIARELDRPNETSLSPPEDREWIDTIVSIRFDSAETLMFPTSVAAVDWLAYGPDLLRTGEKRYGYRNLRLEEWTTNFPTSGLHVDAVDRRVYVWHAEAIAGELERLRGMWIGWEIEDLQDNYEQHADLTNQALVFQTPDEPAMLADIEKSLLREAGNPIASFNNVLERLKEREAGEINVNPAIAMHVSYNKPMEERVALLQAAKAEDKTEAEACHYHDDRGAELACGYCKRPMCTACVDERNGYCWSCSHDEQAGMHARLEDNKKGVSFIAKGAVFYVSGLLVLSLVPLVIIQFPLVIVLVEIPFLIVVGIPVSFLLEWLLIKYVTQAANGIRYTVGFLSYTIAGCAIGMLIFRNISLVGMTVQASLSMFFANRVASDYSKRSILLNVIGFIVIIFLVLALDYFF